MHIASEVRITEVGPRDGLQSFPRTVRTNVKVAMVQLLVGAGFRSIEVTSFARPEVVPQMADAEKVVADIERRGDVDFRALVPNRRGAERAVAAGIDTLVALLTVTESYSRKNQNLSVEELIGVVASILEYGRAVGVPVDVAMGMAFFDPYEGDTPPERVEWVVEKLFEAGARNMYVATSVGMADPSSVNGLCRRLLSRWPELELGIHLHNTNGMALANAIAAMDAGVRWFEGSICGIGGGIVMPHDMTVGNVPTEDLVHMFDEMGVNTGLDVDRVIQCARAVGKLLDIEPTSYATRGGRKADLLRLGVHEPRRHSAHR